MTRAVSAVGQPQSGLSAPRALAGVLLLAAFLLTMSGCKQPNIVSPRAAARTFVQAMVSGDEQAMRNISEGDETSAQVLAAQARQNAAYERLSAAAKSRFGDPSQVLAGRRADDHYASRLARIDSEQEVISGNTATVGEGPNTIYLQRAGDSWKVDRSRLVPPSLDGAAEHIKLIDAIRAADERVTAAIVAGKYPTAADARAALLKQMNAAIRGTLGEPETRPTTNPSSRPTTAPVP